MFSHEKSLGPILLLVMLLLPLFLLAHRGLSSTMEPGREISHTVMDISFSMHLAPPSLFPTGIENEGEAAVDSYFWIAETPLTYGLWYVVRTWAEENGYQFANRGQEGSQGEAGATPSEYKDHPVTKINWRDAIIWCNALSEYKGYSPVYLFQGEVIRDSTFHNAIACDNAVQEEREGFRLPTSREWELAARYRGSDPSYGAIEYPLGSGSYWLPGDYASGAVANYQDEEATTAAAWFRLNSDIDGSGLRTQDVGLRPEGGNKLGLFDMSGNVWEWCFDWDPKHLGANRIRRGGGWFSNPYNLLVGNVYSVNPVNANSSFSFRLVRTHSQYHQDPTIYRVE